MLETDKGLGKGSYISGTNKEIVGCSIQACDEGLRLETEDGQCKGLEYPGADTLNIIILDHYNKTVMCERFF